MDWKLAAKEERAALQRIVALLLALARLAESTHTRSRPVRAFVLWLLRPAETLARDFVIGADPPAFMTVGPDGDAPAEAIRLALSFYDLACELDLQARFVFAVHDDAGQAGLARFGPCRAFDTDRFLDALHGLVFGSFSRHAAQATGPPDTS